MKQASFADMRCSIARTLDQVGPWWSLLIVRDAMMGVRRFRDFERSLGIAKNTLTKRLAELVEHGILAKVPSESGSSYAEYELIHKVFEVDPLECTRGGATMRIIALIDEPDVVERILRHLKLQDPLPEPAISSGPDPPWAEGETLPITDHPVPEIA